MPKTRVPTRARVTKADEIVKTGKRCEEKGTDFSHNVLANSPPPDLVFYSKLEKHTRATMLQDVEFLK